MTVTIAMVNNRAFKSFIFKWKYLKKGFKTGFYSLNDKDVNQYTYKLLNLGSQRESFLQKAYLGVLLQIYSEISIYFKL